MAVTGRASMGRSGYYQVRVLGEHSSLLTGAETWQDGLQTLWEYSRKIERWDELYGGNGCNGKISRLRQNRGEGQ